MLPSASIDYAGGTAVHINAGAAALALALVLGKRVGFAKGIHKPHNLPFVLLGAGLLWFGWFGFNAGAEFLNDWQHRRPHRASTRSAPPLRRIIGWLVVEKIKDGKPTSVGAASGAVAGLVAITPACAQPDPGLGAAARCHRRCRLCPRGRAEVQARLRRLARRRRHPPRRWFRRNPLPGLLRHGTGLFVGGDLGPARGSGDRSLRCADLLLRGRFRHLASRSRRRSASASRTKTRSPESTPSFTARRATCSPQS